MMRSTPPFSTDLADKPIPRIFCFELLPFIHLENFHLLLQVFSAFSLSLSLSLSKYNSNTNVYGNEF